MALLDGCAVPGGRMSARLKLFYPFLFIIIPILNIVARNPGGSTLGDMAALMLVMLLACAVVYAVTALVLKRWAPRGAVPLVVLAAITGFYSYPAVRSMYGRARGLPADMVLVAAAVLTVAVAIVAGISWISRRPSLLDRVNTFLALTGLFLVAFLGARVVAGHLRAQSQLRDSALVRVLTRPIPAASAPNATGKSRPDVYLIVLDEYANSSVLQERFGFDNRVFEDSLRKLGFTVPALVRSNYAQTVLSLASLLNFSHVNTLEAEVGPGSMDPRIPNFLVENNRTTAFLKARGYRFVFFPSQWWTSTRRNRNADVEFSAWDGLDLVREASRSDFRRAFVGRTPLALLHRSDPHDADHVKRTLAALEQLGSDSAPTYAFAHILNPHYPYVFDASCRTHPSRPNLGWGQGREKAYLEQMQCLNSLLLGTVTRLLERSSPPPIILLVGDHGTALSPTPARLMRKASPLRRHANGSALLAPFTCPKAASGSCPTRLRWSTCFRGSSTSTSVPGSSFCPTICICQSSRDIRDGTGGSSLPVTQNVMVISS